VEPPIEHRDVTTIMGLLADIHEDVQAIRHLLEDENGEEEAPEVTPEDLARRAETQRMVRERIAYHEAKAREDDARRAERRG
jgi:hypothetical protein